MKFVICGNGEDLGSVDKIVTKVKSHGVKLYKLSKKQV